MGSAEQKAIRETQRQKKNQINKKQKQNLKYKTIRRIQKEARFIAPIEQNKKLIKAKLGIGHRAGDKSAFNGRAFQKNLKKLSRQQKKKSHLQKDVDKFLL